MIVDLPKKALVTGGAGFLGAHLCRRLLADGYEVTCVDNLFTGMKTNIDDLLENKRFIFLFHDVTQPFRGQFDEIYNLACPASPIHYQRNPLETLWTAIFGLKNCLDLARDTGARVLHASTSEIYGDPLVHPQVESYWGNVNTIGIRSCYDEGKRVGETMAADYHRCHGVDVRLVRIFNTYGPYMHPQDGRVISNFIMQALKNQDITIFGDGSQTRSFQYCDDLIEAMRRYMSIDKAKLDAFFPTTYCENHRIGVCTNLSWSSKFELEKRNLTPPAPTSNSNSQLPPTPTQNSNSSHPSIPVINTGNPGEYTIRQLAEKTIELVNESARRLHLPPTTSQIVYRPLPGDDPKKRKPDITLAKELLGGWEPKVQLDDGLVRTIEYFRQRYT